MQSPGSPSYRFSIVDRVPFSYGWIILGISALAIFFSGPGQTYSVSIFVDPIISETGWSRTLVSGLYTAGTLIAGVLVILAGRLLDRYGARIMMTAVVVLFGFAAIWMSSVNHPIQLAAGFVAIRTLGQGSLTLIPTALIALWFIRWRGKATAICILGGAISHSAFPLLIHALITNAGWRNTWLVLAFGIWIVLLPPTALLIRRNPESVGLLPDGQSPSAKDQPEKDKVDTVREVNLSLGKASRTRTFWLLLFAGAAPSLITTALTFHHVSFLASKGIPPGIAASIFGIMGPMQILGIFITGYMADRLPNRYLMAAGQMLLVATMLWAFLITSTWQAFFYGALMGLSNGCLMTISTIIWPNYYGRLHLGSIRGVTTSSIVAFSALGPLPFGFLFDLTKTYSLAILIFLALPVPCTVAALLAHPPDR
ncbi:MAG: MFS transporter [Dehalococcoidales bacterium]|nr:MFS transporter [Dehalococcoidales bacterium]